MDRRTRIAVAGVVAAVALSAGSLGLRALGPRAAHPGTLARGALPRVLDAGIAEAREADGACPAALPDDVRADARAGGTLIAIWKAQYKLGFYRDGTLVERDGDAGPACFDVALGFEPVGAKTVRGDGKTPEGWYWVSWKIPQGSTSFYKALYVSYPNAADAAAGLAAGRIDRTTHDRIVRAAKRRSTVTDSALGGLIEIHGSGNWPRTWTLGCVALDNGDMDWLYDAAESGKTAIWIHP